MELKFSYHVSKEPDTTFGKQLHDTEEVRYNSLNEAPPNAHTHWSRSDWNPHTIGPPLGIATFGTLQSVLYERVVPFSEGGDSTVLCTFWKSSNFLMRTLQCSKSLPVSWELATATLSLIRLCTPSTFRLNSTSERASWSPTPFFSVATPSSLHCWKSSLTRELMSVEA